MTLQLLEPEHSQLLELIRSCLTIDWQPEQSYPLTGGMSGATVMRLSVKWQTAAETLFQPYSIASTHVGSTVVKVGDWAVLARAEAAYAKIPLNYQHYFARIISGPHRLQRASEAYLLEEDLTNYITLCDALAVLDATFQKALREQFLTFLHRFYGMPSAEKREEQAGANHIEWLYLSPMEQTLQRLEAVERHLLTPTNTLATLQTQLAQLRKCYGRLTTIPLTVMHGDLHLRNIMLNEIRPELGDIDFRLIDLDHFRHVGDKAYDLGELLVDLEMCAMFEMLPMESLRLSRSLEAEFCRDAHEKREHTFQSRLALGKARSCLKLLEVEVMQILRRILPVDNLPRVDADPEKIPTVLVQANLAQVHGYLDEALGMCKGRIL